MTDLTKASEALLDDEMYERLNLSLGGPAVMTENQFRNRLLAIEAAVRSDTLADVAARLPEALDAVFAPASMGPLPPIGPQALAAAILAHLTPDR